MRYIANCFILVFVLGLGSMFCELATANIPENNGMSKSVDGITMVLAFKAEKIKKGINDLEIVLHDEKDQALGKANVRISAGFDDGIDMSNMVMPEPRFTVLTEGNEQGHYVGNADFTSAGKWNLKIRFTVQGQEKKTELNIVVVDNGPNWAVIGGFSAIITLIIIVAGITKHRSTRKEVSQLADRA